MTARTAWLDLRRSRGLTLGLLLVLAAYGGIIGAMYPVIRQNIGVLEDYMKVWPKEFLTAFGMTGSLADHGVFFATYIGGLLWPVVAALGGIMLGTRPAGDVDRGFMELPLATPLSRVRYLAVAVLGQSLVLAILAVGCLSGILLAGAVAGAGFDVARFLMVAPLALAFATAIASVSTLVAIVSLRRGLSAGIVAGGLLAMYLFNVVALIDPDLEWLAGISLFRYFDTAPIIDAGRFPLGDFALLAAVSAGAWAVAFWAFRRRELIV